MWPAEDKCWFKASDLHFSSKLGSFCFFSLSAKSCLPPSSSVSPSTKPSSPWPSSRSSMSWSISEWTWATLRVFAQLLSLPDQQLNPSNFALHPNCLHHHHYLPLHHRQSEKNIRIIAKEGHPLFVVAFFGGAGGSYSLHYISYSYNTYHSGYRHLHKTTVGQDKNDLTRNLSSVEIDVL